MDFLKVPKCLPVVDQKSKFGKLPQEIIGDLSFNKQIFNEIRTSLLQNQFDTEVNIFCSVD